MGTKFDIYDCLVYLVLARENVEQENKHCPVPDDIVCTEKV